MDKIAKKNPLASPQREKAGATTFSKYDYQYHWALCRLLDEHETENDYVVFIELHEDVVISDSKDSEKARFEFNQIKNVSSWPYTARKVTEIKKTSSILGKLVAAVKGKEYYEKIDSLNLVATNGFNLKQKNPDLQLKKIKINDLSQDTIKSLKSSLKEETGDDDIPNFLNFVTPDLSATDFKNSTNGRIAHFMNARFPNTYCNSINIYRSIIDDLQTKGQVAFDFPDWNDLIKEKGVSRNQVEEVLNAHLKNKHDENQEGYFNEICLDLSLKFHEKTNLRREFDKYGLASKFTRSNLQIDMSVQTQRTVNDNYNSFTNSGIQYFLTSCMDASPIEVTKFQDELKYKAALLYELIERIINDDPKL